MARTLLMERLLGQTRLAVIEDGALCELYVDRPDSENLTGNLYLGRVENVLAGMSAAFVNIGLEKNGFLPASDLRSEFGDRALTEALSRAGGKLPRPGETVLVQVLKSQTGQKGPRLSGCVTLPGRNMVLMPGVEYVGVSKKIDDEAERRRLRDIGRGLTEASGAGVILRTAAQGAARDALRAEYDSLLALWRQIETRAQHAVAPAQLYSDVDLELKAVRDLLGEDVDALWADGEALCESLADRAKALAPDFADRVRLHEGATPLFDLYRVDEQADKALQKHVWLKSGGFLVIEPTEALTVVDVNTGKFTGRKDVEETIFRLNCEASIEIMRQLRLRDIGGIVVIDFINMADPARRRQLLDVLREAAKRDHNRVNIEGMTPLGLVELTRKKARQPLAKQLMHTCPDCGGNGMVPSHETTARRIERAIWRRRRAGETNPILVEAQAKVCGWLKTLGAPEGGALYVCPADDVPAGEYRLSPADPAALPPGSKLLK